MRASGMQKTVVMNTTYPQYVADKNASAPDLVPAGLVEVECINPERKLEVPSTPTPLKTVDLGVVSRKAR